MNIDYNSSIQLEAKIKAKLLTANVSKVGAVNKVDATRRTIPLVDEKVTVEKKVTADKKVTVEKKSNKKHNPYLLLKNPTSITIKARITNISDDNGTAAYDINENQSINDVFFYKILKSKHTQHLKFLSNDDLRYHSPYNTTEFKFQTTKNILYYDKVGLANMLNSSVGELCLMTLRVVPYDFLNQNKKRIVGLCIKVSAIQCV